MRRTLYAAGPEFCSVTYGAGGSTQDGTFGAVREIRQKASVQHPISPVSVRPATPCAASWLLKGMGVRPAWWPCGATALATAPAAVPVRQWLVAFIRAGAGRDFHIGCAAYPEVHPQARSPQVT